jgi:ABC-type antimicrobial peptide transport system permease subunit
MFKNYLKIAFRNILRHKGYSFINISGMALGLSCCILIMLWVVDELSFDRFHTNIKNLYQIGIRYDQGGGKSETVTSSPSALAPALKEEFPEIINASRRSFPIKMSLAYKNKIFNESLHFASPSFLNLFDFPIKKGQKKTALKNPYSILMTEDLAKKYFGEESPLGKTVLLNNTYNLMVTGVLNNPPANSSITFSGLLPFKLLKELGARLNVWDSNDYITYVLLDKKANVDQVNQKISARQHREVPEWASKLFLFPVSKIHLFSFDGKNNQIQSVYTFAIIGFLILLIACINFMNLTTARSTKRAREVGLRKVFGVNRKKLMIQFYGESITMVVIALALALLLSELALPYFNHLSAKTLSLSLLFKWYSIPAIFVMIIFTALLAGSYPALVLSSFKPVTVIQRYPQGGQKQSKFRKVMVVLQFSLSIILFISTIMVYRQLGFMQSKDIGFDKDNILSIKANSDMYKNYESFKNQMLVNPGIKNISTSWTLPSEAGYFDSDWEWKGKNPNRDIGINKTWVNYDYLDTMGMKLVQGRFFSKKFPGDQKETTVINEELAQQFGTGSAIGKVIFRKGQQKKVIGVVKNYHYLPVSRQIGPLMLHLSPRPFRYIFIKISAQNVSKTIAFTQQTFHSVFPGSPFEFSFMDEAYDRYYRSEQRLGGLLNGFTLLAIFISCLGLFGLASFMAEQRTKEIGIRKVLGASVNSVTTLLSKEFLKWVLLSNLIAWPVAYLIIKNWLKNFAYRTSIDPAIFMISGLLALAIAFITVSYQSIRAATANPVETLRYE